MTFRFIGNRASPHSSRLGESSSTPHLKNAFITAHTQLRRIMSYRHQRFQGFLLIAVTLKFLYSWPQTPGQDQLFKQHATERKKKPDQMTEGSQCEPMVEFNQ